MTAAPGAAVEVATWPPVEVIDVDGWSLGLSAGFTRRANSVVAWSAPPDVDAALARVEEIYTRRGLPAIFRVCRSSRPADLDGRLAARGYAVRAPTVVMAADVGTGRVAESSGEDLAGGRRDGGLRITRAADPAISWLAGWLEVKTATADDVDLALARRILTGSPAVYVEASDDHGPAGVLRVAFVEDWVGISSLMVRARARRRGVAIALTAAAITVAGERGASRAFLQVEAENAPARALYERLGFEVVDRYHYRQR